MRNLSQRKFSQGNGARYYGSRDFNVTLENVLGFLISLGMFIKYLSHNLAGNQVKYEIYNFFLTFIFYLFLFMMIVNFTYTL